MIICFLIYRIEKRYRRNISRPYKVEGLQTTVHATSKSAALKLLDVSYPGMKFQLVINMACDPSKLGVGNHCPRNLIVKDQNDPTPLGYILPHSPEWNERYGFDASVTPPSISKRRQEKIDQAQKRKDIFD